MGYNSSKSFVNCSRKTRTKILMLLFLKENTFSQKIWPNQSENADLRNAVFSVFYCFREKSINILVLYLHYLHCRVQYKMTGSIQLFHKLYRKFGNNYDEKDLVEIHLISSQQNEDVRVKSMHPNKKDKYIAARTYLKDYCITVHTTILKVLKLLTSKKLFSFNSSEVIRAMFHIWIR